MLHALVRYLIVKLVLVKLYALPVKVTINSITTLVLNNVLRITMLQAIPVYLVQITVNYAKMILIALSVNKITLFKMVLVLILS